jgi:hypothetical protein
VDVAGRRLRLSLPLGQLRLSLPLLSLMQL